VSRLCLWGRLAGGIETRAGAIRGRRKTEKKKKKSNLVAYAREARTVSSPIISGRKTTTVSRRPPDCTGRRKRVRGSRSSRKVDSVNSAGRRKNGDCAVQKDSKDGPNDFRSRAKEKYPERWLVRKCRTDTCWSSPEHFREKEVDHLEEGQSEERWVSNGIMKARSI